MVVKIVTNYINQELYSISKEFYKSFEFEKIGVYGNDGFYGLKFLNFLMTDKSFSDVDWVIYIDEDCFITNKQAVLDLLDYQIKNKIHCSGVPDGGVIGHRQHNPISINSFFSIINIGEMRKNYSEIEMNSMFFGDDLIKHLPKTLIKNNNFRYDNFEPTYKLFFWLLRNSYNMCYLDANDFIDDKTTTIVYNHKNVELAYHTWYARKWSENNHRIRIEKIINYCNKIKK